jgi:hypothetical protein
LYCEHGSSVALFTGFPTGRSDPSSHVGSSGTVAFDVIAPVADVLFCQQLPTPWSSHQKSTPFGCTIPAGWNPSRFPTYRLPLEVSSCCSSPMSPRMAPGTQKSIAPYRQLS